jgi:hypothetical protein
MIVAKMENSFLIIINAAWICQYFEKATLAIFLFIRYSPHFLIPSPTRRGEKLYLTSLGNDITLFDHIGFEP